MTSDEVSPLHSEMLNLIISLFIFLGHLNIVLQGLRFIMQHFAYQLFIYKINTQANKKNNLFLRTLITMILDIIIMHRI